MKTGGLATENCESEKNSCEKPHLIPVIGLAPVEGVYAVKLFEPDEKREFVLEGVSAQAPAVGHAGADGSGMTIGTAEEDGNTFCAGLPEVAGDFQPFPGGEGAPGFVEEKGLAAFTLFKQAAGGLALSRAFLDPNHLDFAV